MTTAGRVADGEISAPDLLHLERKDAIGAAGLLIVVDGSALDERDMRLQFREGDNHGVARVEVRRPGGPGAGASSHIVTRSLSRSCLPEVPGNAGGLVRASTAPRG